MGNTQHFRELHQQQDPLLIGNVWDATSARVMERCGIKAIATSSAAVAETLGYNDGEQMTFEEYFFVIDHIVRATALPLSVDIESGYGESPETVAANIERLSAIGVVGINIEDSTVRNGERVMLEKEQFAAKLKAVVNLLRSKSIDMFVNLRCDSFLLPAANPLQDALDRAQAYAATGADALFLPCIVRLEDIAEVVGGSPLPINVMCMPSLPSFDEMRKAGVRRISMGNFLSRTAQAD
ncbi:MAG: isocitrate lyase/phosphoenolpyruvate mutase family protein, partial [Bacteroidia bacterium]|nr:isocitrate lyase/phosphoenolpyruvate mutase family protein [Bacteroidia bacterium]